MRTHFIVLFAIANCLSAQEEQPVRHVPSDPVGTTLQPLFVDVRRYDFAPQLPGGNLVAGSNSIALAPCPSGVSGSDSLHYLYVSGGTGIPEAVQITGGTCRGTGEKGTIVVSAVRSHSGAWTIQSATAGVQEAYNANGAGPRFRLPAAGSPYYFDAPVSASATGGASLFFEGDGYPSGIVTKGTAIVNRGHGNLFNIIGDNASSQIAFEKMALIGTEKSGGAITCSNCGGLRIRDVLQHFSAADGLICSNCTGARIENTFFMGNAGNGATFSAVADAIDIEHSFFYSNCTSGADPCYGLVVYNGIGVVVHASDFEGTGGVLRPGKPLTRGYGAGFNSVFSVSFTGNYCERNITQCLYIGNNVNAFEVSGNYMEESGVLVDAAGSNGIIQGNYFTNVMNGPKNVSGATDNGHGFCRIATKDPHLLTEGSFVYLKGIGGTTNCDGSGVVTRVQTANAFEVSIPFSSGEYTGGGTALQVSGIKAGPGKNILVSANDTSQTGTFVAGAELINGIGPPIKSALTIVPTNQVHHITGASAIARIVVPGSQPGGYSGTFCSIPDGRFTTITGGNIALASTAVVGRQLCWTYDPEISKWYPTY